MNRLLWLLLILGSVFLGGYLIIHPKENQSGEGSNTALSHDENLINDGLRLDSQGKHREAIEKFTKAIDINPSNVKAYTSRASSFNTVNEYQKAIDDIDKAISIDIANAQGYSIIRDKYISNLNKQLGEQQAANEYEVYKSCIKSKIEDVSPLRVISKSQVRKDCAHLEPTADSARIFDEIWGGRPESGFSGSF